MGLGPDVVEDDLAGLVLEAEMDELVVGIVGVAAGSAGEAEAEAEPDGATGLPKALADPDGSVRAEPPTDRLVVVGAGLDVDVQPAMSAPVTSSATPARSSRLDNPPTFPLVIGRL